MNKREFEQELINNNITMEMYEGIVKDAFEIEINESCHSDYEENYNSKQEFYLSNVNDDNYINFLQESYGINEELAQEVKEDVMNKIKAFE